MQKLKFYQNTYVFKKILIMFLFGISAGLPILLIFSSLGLWLREAGVDKSSVTMFSWAALGYSFKFIWAPLVDKLPILFLTKLLGRRRAWLLVSQTFIIVAIFWLANTNPLNNDGLVIMALASVLLGFSSATQDIVIDAYRIESAPQEYQAIMSSSYIAGYRIGMIVASAGALFIASFFGSSKEIYVFDAWSNAYIIMGFVMLIGVFTTLTVKEPKNINENKNNYASLDYLRLFLVFGFSVLGLILVFVYSDGIVNSLKSQLTSVLSNKVFSSFIVETTRLFFALLVAILIAIFSTKIGVVNKEMISNSYIAPVKDFFVRYGVKFALLLLLLIGLYRISDIVLGVIANLFYQDLGFSKIQIAEVSKTFGLIVTIIGGFAGGLIAIRFGVMTTLLLGAILSALTNLLFILLNNLGAEIGMLYLVISVDNLSGGIATAAFIAFLSKLTNIQFTATQYAIFSSVMTLIPKIIGGYSGSIVDDIGYNYFFLMTAIIGMPIIFLVIMVKNKLKS